jgi:serine/threonine-protein kinase
MNGPSPACQPPTLPALRLERDCDRFEAAWREGQRPRVEDYLGEPADPDHLRDLLAVELAYRVRLDERPVAGEYLARFPDQAAAVRSAFEEVSTAPPAAERRAAGPAPRADSGRDLLFGVLAMQMDFVSREALIAAVSAWVLDRSKPLGRILVEQGALAPDEHALLEPLVRKHLERHGGDPGRSLATVGPLGPLREQLARVADPDLQAGLSSIITLDVAETAAPDSSPAPVSGAGLTPSGVRFRVLRPLARGGLGEVFVARDEELRREVALKAIQEEHADDPDSRSRFLLEAEITGRLEHPGVVPVYGLGRYEDGRPYYAMRLVRGETLKEAIERFHGAEGPARDPAERALALRALLGRFVDVCDAVAYAHSRGVLHRDLKPGNIMLGPYGETLVVDWGLAKAAGRPDGIPGSTDGTIRPESAADSGSTVPGSPLGTPAYMSPEQTEGQTDRFGPASDVYGLGATLYHLLTGRPPIEGGDVFEALRKVRKGDVPPARAVNRHVPKALEAVCRRAMSVRPEDRYPTPRALADDLEHWLAGEAVSAYREPAPARVARWARRHRTAVTGAAALLVTAAAALAVSTVLIGREAARKEVQRRLAEQNFALARDAVDRMLTEVAEVELADVPQMQPVRKRLLEKARAFYQGFLAQRGSEPAVRRESGRAHLRLGEIDDLLGDHGDSEREFRQGLEILEALVRDRTDWDDARRDLARGQDGLGTLLKKANRFKESEAALQSALRTRGQLADAHPADEADRQGLADARYHLATLLARLGGRRPEDEASYREAVRVQESLVAGSRARPERQRKLARYLNNLGKLLASTGRAVEAEADYREAAAILESLLLADPRTPGDRWQLAQTNGNLAVLLRDTARPEEAEAAGLKARDLQKVLKADFPDVPDYRHELAAILNNLALQWNVNGRGPGAEQALREALGLQEGLAAAFPHRADYRQALAVTRLNLASVLERTDVREAERVYREALAVQERLTAEFPEVPDYQAALGRTLYSLARVLLAGGDPSAARGLLARAVRYHRAALEVDPRSRMSREYLRDDYGVLCLALIQSGAIGQAADTADELPRLFPEDVREYFRAAFFLVKCAAAADATSAGPSGEPPAETYARRAVGLLRRAVDRRLIGDPAVLWVRELDPLRPRADFQELLRKLAASSEVRSG